MNDPERLDAPWPFVFSRWFLAAAAGAPVLTLWLSIWPLLSDGGSDFAFSLSRLSGLLSGLVFFGVFALLLGFFGAALLLGLSFRFLIAAAERKEQVTAVTCALAGSAAGALHVIAAWLVSAFSLDPIGVLLGTYWIRGAFEQLPPEMALAPIAAGAVVGAVCASKLRERTAPRSSERHAARRGHLAPLVTAGVIATALSLIWMEAAPLQGPCVPAKAVRVSVDGVVYDAPASPGLHFARDRREREPRYEARGRDRVYCEAADSGAVKVERLELSSVWITAKAGPEAGYPHLGAVESVMVVDGSRDRLDGVEPVHDERTGPELFESRTAVSCHPADALSDARCVFMGHGPGGSQIQIAWKGDAGARKTWPAVAADVERLVQALRSDAGS